MGCDCVSGTTCAECCARFPRVYLAPSAQRVRALCMLENVVVVTHADLYWREWLVCITRPSRVDDEELPPGVSIPWARQWEDLLRHRYASSSGRLAEVEHMPNRTGLTCGEFYYGVKPER